MAIYTTVDEGYQVDVCASFESLWRGLEKEGCCINGAGRLTKAALKRALSADGMARIYESPESSDWKLKIQKH
jgi:hypothetical protein